jgi:hypothetical protein
VRRALLLLLLLLLLLRNEWLCLTWQCSSGSHHILNRWLGLGMLRNL